MIAIMLDELFETASLLDHTEGTTLFRAGDKAEFIFQVVEGSVLLERHLPDGRTVCQQRAGAGDVVAEASLYADTYHCSARCGRNTILRAVRIPEFKGLLAKSTSLASEWAAHLAQKVQHARLISEIRGLRSVADRLDAWLAAYPQMPQKGLWQTVADEIAVSREALYRELAKRRT